MLFEPAELNGVYLIKQQKFGDDRGWFARVHCEDEMRAAGLVAHYAQINHSACVQRGTLRGLHYQLPPFAEAKLVRCTRGIVYDAVVDVRKDSDTFLKWYGVELNDSDGLMLYCPKGFAHGYQALSDGAEVSYMASSSYHPESERQIRFDDPSVGIEWPIDDPILSEKDQSIPLIESDFQGVTL